MYARPSMSENGISLPYVLVQRIRPRALWTALHNEVCSLIDGIPQFLDRLELSFRGKYQQLPSGDSV